MHAIEEAKGCMQKGKDFNRLQAKFFWRKPFSGETPSLGEKSFLGRSHFWGEALFGEKPFSGEKLFSGRSHSGEKPLKKCLKVRQKLGTRKNYKNLKKLKI